MLTKAKTLSYHQDIELSMENLGALDILLGAGIVMLGGLTKGLVGLGMPLVAVPLLSHLMPVPQAISVMVMPMLATNMYQMVHGGQMRPTLRRFWPLLLTFAIGTPVGTYFLTTLKASVVSLVLGIVVILFTLFTFFQPRVTITREQERWVGPSVGLFAGFLGGVAGQFGPPIGIYLVALRLSKDRFIGAVGTSFGIGTVPLLVSLLTFGIFGRWEFLYSALGLAPAFVGLLIGQRARAWIPQDSFRTAVLIALLATGLALIRRGVLG